jgi:hypothetical protein
MSQCLVSDVLEDIAPNVEDAGICATTADGKARIIKALDLALDALMKRIDTEGALWTWMVPVVSGCFALPEDCLEARQIFVNGASAIQRDKWFQGRLARGIRDCGQPCVNEVRDLGDFATPQPLPPLRPIRVALIAEQDADANAVITVEVINEYGERKKETLTLLAGQQPVIMESPAYQITFVGKPKTSGPVKLYLSYDNGQRFFLCEYGPNVRVGAFRRKKLPQRHTGCAQVHIFGKRRYDRITAETDLIPICDRIALSFAVSAIADLRKRDQEGYNTNMTFALNELWKGLENADSAGNVAPLQFISGFGSNPSQAGGRRCWS